MGSGFFLLETVTPWLLSLSDPTWNPSTSYSLFEGHNNLILTHCVPHPLHNHQVYESSSTILMQEESRHGKLGYMSGWALHHQTTMFGIFFWVSNWQEILVLHTLPTPLNHTSHSCIANSVNTIASYIKFLYCIFW